MNAERFGRCMFANLPARVDSPGVKGLGGVLVTGRRQRGLGSGSKGCPSRFLGCFVLYVVSFGENSKRVE